jgi:hypothetical protein
VFYVVVIAHHIFLLNLRIRANTTSLKYVLLVFASVHQITIKSCAVKHVFLLEEVTVIKYLNLLRKDTFCSSESSICMCCDVFFCIQQPVFVVTLSFVDLECCDMVHSANAISCICFVCTCVVL